MNPTRPGISNGGINTRNIFLPRIKYSAGVRGPVRACIFPNGPLSSHVKKGYWIPRYYNPGNVFDEIFFFPPSEVDLEPREVQMMCGDAKVEIHCMGRANLFNVRSKARRTVEEVRAARPDVIISYNALYGGYLGARCARRLGVPFLVRLHTQLDGSRQFLRRRSLPKYLVHVYTGRFIEPYVLESADRIIAVYDSITPYVRRHGHEAKLDIIHNGVDLAKFSEGGRNESLPRPLVLSVGRLTAVKGLDTVIRAMKDIDAHLLIIGDGEMRGELEALAASEGIADRVTFKGSVPNSSIHGYYRSADVFAMGYKPELGNLAIPVIESMAAGVPVVVPQAKEEFEGFGSAVVYADDNPRSFADRINGLLRDPALRAKYSRRVQETAAIFDVKKTEAGNARIITEMVTGGGG
ncbi:glycosyltransferase [Cenarchaeum symbiosum A]|uniref:Glycosyltransferase n=1 Tax=Cenarchaeum symbiosum (strain A) TaxID=414004 RepID=A0RWB0_CENSY|nr:glycosyltransferase [Cenarchaeum symbiosum A]